MNIFLSSSHAAKGVEEVSATCSSLYPQMLTVPGTVGELRGESVLKVNAMSKGCLRVQERKKN